jgi:hypothetical protein
MEIIKLQKNDIKNALELIGRVFQEFEAPDYSEQGVMNFKDFISYDSINKKVDEEELIFWGCSMYNNLTGVIAIRGISHICMFL